MGARQTATRWLRWTDSDGFPWHVGLTWARVPGGPCRLVGVEVWSTEPGSDRADAGPVDEEVFLIMDPQPVGTAVLRSLPLGAVERSARDEVISVLRGDPEFGDAVTMLAARPTRPARYPPEHFVEVADVYLAAKDVGLDPLVELQERWPGVSKSTVAHWVYRCRHRLGLLPPVQPWPTAGRT